MKKSKIFQLVVIIMLGLIALYTCFIYNRADTVAVSSYVDDSMYKVYTGKNVYEYHRENLNDTEKIVYDELKESYLQFRSELSTKVDKLEKKELDNSFVALILDHPEIFWINSYSATINIFNNINTKKVIILKYTYSEEEAINEKQKIQATYEDIISNANKLDTDFQKVKYVHDKLIEIGNYTEYLPNEVGKYQSIVSIFDNGDTVCAGFAYGFKFIMDNLGIKSIAFEEISKKDKDESHIWNMVYLDDTWKNIDITWDNAESTQKVSYKYFLIDNDEFYKTHTMPEVIPNK